MGVVNLINVASLSVNYLTNELAAFYTKKQSGMKVDRNSEVLYRIFDKLTRLNSDTKKLVLEFEFLLHVKKLYKI